MINVTRLSEADNRVDQDIRLARTCGPDGELTMGAMHRIASLESHYTIPAKLLEVGTELCRSVTQCDVIVMIKTVNSFDFATDIEVVS